MNINVIAGIIILYGVFAAAGSAAFYLVVSTRFRMRRQQKHHLEESQALREDLAALKEVVAKLEATVQKLGVDVSQNAHSAPACPPSTGLDVQKREEALRMYRRGSDRQTISTALGLTLAEVALLEKVHFLNSGAASALAQTAD
jgi:hypothetical protein